MYFCEVCNREGDVHHIVFKCEGGVDFPLNYKYLCPDHHRGKEGPHKNKSTNLKYKLQMQEKLSEILPKDYYKIEELSLILQMNKSYLKKLFKNLKFYKEGYLKDDIVFKLMGNKQYSEEMLDFYYFQLANY